jgi:uncharacterized membrane protein
MKSYRIIFPKDIVILLTLAILLIAFRALVLHMTSFLYLIWNLFLAGLPFVVSSLLVSYARQKKISRIVYILGGIVWLLLLPNAPYMITDLIHITEGHSLHFFYNTLLFFSSAIVGLLFFLYSLSHIEELLRMKFSQKKTIWMLMGIIFLASFGVCLGRFFRFNSWDTITQPLSLFKNIFTILSLPQSYTHVYTLTGAFFIFLVLSYYAWKSTRERVQ